MLIKVYIPTNTNLEVITVKIITNLPISCITIYLPKVIYYFPLRFIPKLNKTFCYIYNFSLPKPRRGLSVNAIILKAYSTLTYNTIDEILVLILFIKGGAVIFKRDFKNTF